MKDNLQCYYPGCKKQYESKYNLVRHVNNCHLCIKKYFCQQCSRRFPDKQGLRIHEQTHLKPQAPFRVPIVRNPFEFRLSEHYEEVKELPKLSITQLSIQGLPPVDFSRQQLQTDQPLPLIPILIPEINPE